MELYDIICSILFQIKHLLATKGNKNYKSHYLTPKQYKKYKSYLIATKQNKTFFLA